MGERRASVPRLILDAGAVIALARGDSRLRARLRAAAEDDADVVVPPIVVTQTFRGSPGDARINRLLKVVLVPPVGLELAREAGALLGTASLSDAADAQVAAEALRQGPSVILTSDPDDLRQLIQGRPGVQISRV
jgi:predicted nucleic acid-binding protein